MLDVRTILLLVSVDTHTSLTRRYTLRSQLSPSFSSWRLSKLVEVGRTVQFRAAGGSREVVMWMCSDRGRVGVDICQGYSHPSFILFLYSHLAL
jgi:hypothetical protein